MALGRVIPPRFPHSHGPCPVFWASTDPPQTLLLFNTWSVPPYHASGDHLVLCFCLHLWLHCLVMIWGSEQGQHRILSIPGTWKGLAPNQHFGSVIWINKWPLWLLIGAFNNNSSLMCNIFTLCLKTIKWKEHWWERHLTLDEFVSSPYWSSAPRDCILHLSHTPHSTPGPRPAPGECSVSCCGSICSQTVLGSQSSGRDVW